MTQQHDTSPMARFRAPVPALPVDLFRIAVGFIALIYFARTLLEVPDFSATGGLLDHGIGEEIFWFTLQPLFRPWMGVWAFQGIFAVACGLSVALILGIKPRGAALLLYLTAACTYRWNFLAMYIDDMVMHLMLFWVMLMPVGRTLTLGRWRSGERLADWSEAVVSGGVVRLFMANLTLLYFVAGVTKWSSPMWLEGNALLAVLKLPASWAPDFWSVEHLPVLKLACWIALVVEPLLALMVLLPAGHPLKRALGVFAVAFHLGIIALVDVVFANLGCLAALLIVFRGQAAAGSTSQKHGEPLKMGLQRLSEGVGGTAVALLVGAMLCAMVMAPWRAPSRDAGAISDEEAPLITKETGGAVQSVFFSGLWLMGLAQQYRLLDWIDDRNFHLELQVVETPEGDGDPRHVDAGRLIPSGMRGSIVKTYMLGITWMPVPLEHLPELRESMQKRAAARYCLSSSGPVWVEARARLTRINPGDPEAGVVSEGVLMRFGCRDGAAHGMSLNLNL